MNTSKYEAAELLKNGDTGFIRQAKLPEDFSRAATILNQLSLIHPAASFYSALLIADSSQPDQRDSELELLLLCAALGSPSFTAGREAALKIIPAILGAQENREAGAVLGFLDSGNMRRKTDTHLATLRAACFYRLGRYSEAAELFSNDPPAANSPSANLVDGWGKAITLLAAWKDSPAEAIREKVSDFLFTVPDGEFLLWANTEALSLEGLLSPEEHMVLAARCMGTNYRAMLLSLRPALPETSLYDGPDSGNIFFCYPNLIAYLGRAFQYTPTARGEGAQLFRSWDNLAITGEARYMVLFYAGRIERSLGNYDVSSDYFSRALEYAPDTIQSDACIWYILMNGLTANPSSLPSLVISTMPRWSDVDYFANILDRVSSDLARQRKWNDIFQIFLSLEKKDPSASLAQYAWIAGRTLQEGYIETDRNAESIFRIAFEAESASFYYRAMAASKLGINLTLESEDFETGRVPQQGTESDGAEFLLGLLEYNVDSFFFNHLRSIEEELSFPELRMVAEAFASEGQWLESLRLISRYTRREDYKFNIQDLFLSHPRPYLELVEKYSQEMGVGAEIFYGLIRTESHFMSSIVSRAGAIGLAQFMPATAMDMATRIARRGGPDYRGPNGIDLTDPEVNIHLGCYYLRNLTELMGNPMLALLAYNGGQGRVRRWLNSDRQRGALPLDLFLETVEFAETRDYGRRVLSAAAVYGYLYYEMGMEDAVENIF